MQKRNEISKRTVKILLILLLAAAVFFTFAIFRYWAVAKSVGKLEEDIKQNARSANSSKALIEKVGRLILLPQNEPPSIATINNVVQLQAEIAQLYTQGGGKINKTDTTKPTLKTGLVGHWTFDGADVTANTTTDRSGRGNNGTRNTTTPVMGKIGQGMKFSSNSSSSIVIASSSEIF